MRMSVLAIVLILAASVSIGARAQPPDNATHTTQVPADVRSWYRNPDGLCVQCPIGICGVWQSLPQAYPAAYPMGLRRVHGERSVGVRDGVRWTTGNNTNAAGK